MWNICGGHVTQISGPVIVHTEALVSGGASEASVFPDVRAENSQRSFPHVCFDGLMLVWKPAKRERMFWGVTTVSCWRDSDYSP